MTAERDVGRVSTKRAWAWSLAALVLLVAVMTTMRVEKTLADPNFDARDASGLLKSDPALLYYLVERVVESHGSIPSDWNADPRIEHPTAFDIPAHLPVAQEFVVAWLRLALGDALPLHVFCLWVAGAFASFALVGVWLLAAEFTRNAGLALLAAVTAALLPATWRTMGFVLMDEDFSWPFFVLHLGLLARAARLRSPASMMAASAALAAALATWHATSFVFALEAIAIASVCVLRSTNPLRERWTWSAPIVLLATAVVVPFLRHNGFVTSIGMLVVIALWLEGLVPERFAARLGARARILGAALVVGALGFVAAKRNGDDHDHVFALLAAKIEFFGVRPANPLALAPDVRLMWQGPFETLDTATAWTMLGTALVLGSLAVVVALRRRGDARLLTAALLAAFALVGAVLVVRVVVLPALILPALALPLFAEFVQRRTAISAAITLVLVQSWFFAAWFGAYSNPWYAAPVQRQAEISQLVRAIPALVPENEAIAADSINSTAILAHTRRRAILSPKWEARASRDRVVEFVMAFHTLSPEEFRELLVSNYRCRYLLVDRVTLGYLCAYTAGLSGTEPRAGSAASVFLSQDAAILTSVSGYRLLYRSPPHIVQSNGAPADFFRLYALEDTPRAK
ncbi:MAG: hypothetical protein SGI72_12210 [Planctomycetota bacterium]|nr:hypothetical protein [Planctomycetota bacterium]